MAPKYKAIADAAMNDEFTLQGVTGKQPRLKSGSYDWNWRGPKNDPEWAWFFNRLGWLPQLWKVSKESKDDRYRERLYQTLEDWIVANPPPARFTFTSAWRPLEAARRLLYSWLPLIDDWENDPQCPESLKQKLHTSLESHGTHLFKHHALGGNHLITELLALIKLTSKCPHLKEAPKWSTYAYKRLDLAYKQQVYPDGVHKELSSHYHRIVTQNFTQLLTLSTEAKHLKEIAKWTPRINQMWLYLQAITKPDGSNPINNDSDKENFSKLLKRRNLNNETIKSTHFPYAGHTIFRGNNRPHWAFFDTGPRGTDHQHDDLLSLSLSIGQSDFLIDCGRYNYAPGKWRDYFAGPAAHNGIVIENNAPNQGPKQTGSLKKDTSEYATLNNSPISGNTFFQSENNARFADWKRSINYTTDVEWTIKDEIITFGSKEIKTFWHWHPECILSGSLNSKEGILIQNGAETLTLRLEKSDSEPMVEIVTGREHPTIQGWYSERFQTKVPSPTLIITQRSKKPLQNIWTLKDQALEII